MKKVSLFFFMLCINNLLSQIVIIKDGSSNSKIQNATLSYKSTGVTSNEIGEANISIFNSDILSRYRMFHTKLKKLRKKILIVLFT